MKTTIVAIAAAAMLASSSAQARYLSKGQACEERVVKETYPVALRAACRHAGTECKRLIAEWGDAVALGKRNCINEPMGDLK